MAQQADNDFLLVHRCRFAQIQPTAITALALNDAESLIAVARENGSIEVWNLLNNFSQQRVLPASGSTRRLNFMKVGSESQEIVGASGLDGTLRLYDINTQSKLLEYYLGCGPIWDQWHVTDLPETKREDLLIANHDVMLFAGDDASIRVVFVPRDLQYVTSSSMALVEHIVLKAGTKRLTSVCALFSPESQCLWVYGGSQDGKLYRWDLKLHGHHASGLTPVTLAPSSMITLQNKAVPWSLQVYKTGALAGQVTHTAPHTVLVGNSDGILSVWDGAMGVLTQTLEHHKADILRLVLSPSTGSLFSVGVDNTISLFQRSSNTTALGSMEVDVKTSAAPWTFVAQRRAPHTHDILAVVAGSDCLYSGGVDTKLIAHEYQDLLKVPGRAYLPFVQNGAQIASLFTGSRGKRDRMLVQYDQRLQIWRLGVPLKGGNIDPKTNHHDILEEQALLLDITPKVQGRIQCHAVSASGHRIAFSDNVTTKIFCIRERGISKTFTDDAVDTTQGSEMDVDQTNAENADNQFLAAFSDPILTVERKFVLKGPSSRLTIAPNGVLVRATPNTHLIQTWDISDPDCPSLLHTFDEHASVKPALSGKLNTNTDSASTIALPINLLQCSAKGNLLASSDLLNRVFVYSLQSNQLIYELPQFEEQVTALAFDPEGQKLAVALASNRVWIYDIEARSITAWSHKHSLKLPTSLTEAQERIVGMVFHPKTPGMLFVYGHSFLFYAYTTAGSSTRLWKFFKSYQPLFADFVDNEALAVIERPWLKVMQFFPPPFYRHRYAT